MLDEKTQQKYLKIIEKGSTLKLDASDAVDLLEKYKDELNFEDQTGVHIKESSISKCKGKVIIKFFTLWRQDNKKILYWSPCSLDDIALIAGASEFNTETNKYDKAEWIPRNKQISFLGGDIKKACANYESNDYLKNFVDRYVSNEHPIADNIFYIVYMKNKDVDQNFKCARNTILSPRPEKKSEEAK